MATPLPGIDHIYVTVRSMDRSEAFYDLLTRALGLHKGDKAINGRDHRHELSGFLNPLDRLDAQSREGRR